MSEINAKELLADFSSAFLSSGKINSRWRAKHLLAGEAILKAVPDAESIQEAVFRLQNGIIRPVCSCGARVSFSYKTGEYSKFCSPKCSQLDKTTKNRREQTNLERYGTPNAGGFGTKEHKAAMMTKYGAEHPMHAEQIKAKIKETNLARYGVTNVFANDLVKDKIVGTNLTRHNVLHNMQRQEVKAQFRNSDGSWKPAVANIELRKANRLATITQKVIARIAEQYTLLSSPKSFKYTELHQVQHLLCGSIFETRLYAGVMPRCFTCEPLLHGTSNLEIKVQEYISSLGIEFETHRRILDGKEIDIFIPSKKIGFEVNGIYWHSELRGVGADYHLTKTLVAEKAGIALVHLFEDDICNHWNAVCSIIQSKLGLNTKIPARKCEVQIIDNSIAHSFCDQNHVRGKAKCQVSLGLFNNDNLIMVGTFAKPRYLQSQNGEYELIRMCSTMGVTVVGGRIKTHASIYQDKGSKKYSKLCRSFSQFRRSL